MQEDLIVVDDNEPSGSGLDTATNTDYFYGNPATPATPATPMSTVSTSGRPRRAASMAQPPTLSDSLDRLRGTQKSKAQPKLKLKLSEKAVAQAPGMSFLGPYDRELDSDDDEDLVFEEQFILRLPPGEDCEKLKKVVSSREVSDDVWFKFKGASTAFRVYPRFRELTYDGIRFAAWHVSHRKLDLLLQARRPSMRHRITKDLGQQADVQGRGYLSGFVGLLGTHSGRC